MGFLHPAFLLAALALALPLLIHLFNLRRYKQVYFPHSRFLQAIPLRSRRSSQLRYRWLLAMRLLFLAALVCAFARPYLRQRDAGSQAARLQVIYIDNNPSLAEKEGLRSGLDRVIEAVRMQVQRAPAGAQFYLLTNDHPHAYQSRSAAQVLQALQETGIASAPRTAGQVFASVQALMQTESQAAADLYYYSNFPQQSFSAQPEPASLRGIRLHAIAVQPQQRSNMYIDTALLSAPVLQAGAGNSLVVQTRRVGQDSGTAPVLLLSVQGQVKSAASLRFDAQGVSRDTLHFSVAGAGWQRIELSINDAALPYDDTFRIAARSASSLSVLVLNQGAPSPYILAAFRSYAGFRLRSERIDQAPQDWKPYNLIILNGITGLPESVGRQMQEALAAGQSLCIFPAKSHQFSGLNAALAWAGDIHIESLDTSSEEAASLQRGADIVKNMFENIPQDVQLPVAAWHYEIASGYAANGQDILSFRDGSPLFARYSSGLGKLYLCAHAADIEGGNFPASYFFMPFLYQMAAQSRGGDVYALQVGAGQTAFLPTPQSGARNMVHLSGPGLDLIPPQRPAGGGVDVRVDARVQQPGFYWLSSPAGDTALIALNGTRAYSRLELWDIRQLQAQWPDKQASWQRLEAAATAGSAPAGELPLWKVCAILALAFLAAETGLLVAGRRATAPLAST